MPNGNRTKTGWRTFRRCASRRVIAGLAAVILAAPVVSGCSGPLKTDYQIAKERARAYVAKHPELDRKTREAILGSKIRIGMTGEQVIAAWGRPIRVIRFRKGRRQEWTFGCDYPHTCFAEDHKRRQPLFDRIRYESVAVLDDGKVSYFRY